jgi:hypothetical protein
MIDKISLRPIEMLTKERACQLLQGKYSGHITTRSNNFNDVSVFYTGAPKRSPTLMTLYSEPRNSIAGDVKIDINPTHFNCHKEMIETVGLLVNPSTTKISRLDFAVDVKIPIEAINGMLLVPRKRARMEYAEGKDLTGIYYGRPPEILTVYDKALKSGCSGPLTRLEMRVTKHKIPIDTLEDLPLLMTHEPFVSLKFIDTKNPTEFEGNRHQKASFLREHLQILGATGAYKLLNKHHNFNRCFKGILKKQEDIPDLDQLFQQNLKSFFMEDHNGNRQANNC